MKLNPLDWLFPGTATADEVAAAYRAHLDRPHLLTFYDESWNCIASRMMTIPELGAGVGMEPEDRADFWGIDLSLMEGAAWATIADAANATPLRPTKENDQ